MVKILKLSAYLILSTSLWTCNENDDFNNSGNDAPSVFFDINTVTAQSEDANITNFVTLNGQNALLYTSHLQIGEVLQINRPEGLAIDNNFNYNNVRVYLEQDSQLIEVFFNEDNISEDGNLQLLFSANNENFEITAINSRETDINYSYKMEVILTVDNVSFGPYFIDSNIRVESSN